MRIYLRALVPSPAATSTLNVFPSSLTPKVSLMVVETPAASTAVPWPTSVFPVHSDVIVTVPPCPTGVAVFADGWYMRT